MINNNMKRSQLFFIKQDLNLYPLNDAICWVMLLKCFVLWLHTDSELIAASLKANSVQLQKKPNEYFLF